MALSFPQSRRMPRSILLVLLSLFLLLSQQMSTLHDFCTDCAAGAQLAFALPATARAGGAG